MTNRTRVVVTGLGAVTPIAHDAHGFWSALKAGTNGVAPVTHFDATGYRSQLAGEVKDFDPGKWIDRKAADRMDRFAQFAVALKGRPCRP